jgi:hypothetical protein
LIFVLHLFICPARKRADCQLLPMSR